MVRSLSKTFGSIGCRVVVLSRSVQALLPRNILEERALTLSARITNSGGVTEECLEEQVEVHI